MNAVFCRLMLAGLVSCSGVGCMTAYDAYGYPQQVVDPAVAVAGVAAAGLIGYGIANHNNHHHSYYGHGGGYYRPYYGGHHHHH